MRLLTSTKFILLGLISIGGVWSDIEDVDTDGCGKTKGCWFSPPDCENENMASCTDRMKWWQDGDSLWIHMQGKVETGFAEPWQGRYISLAFSYDDKMGDDSVVECLTSKGNNNTIRAFLSFNDGTHNERLSMASGFMLQLAEGAYRDGEIICLVKRRIEPPETLLKIDEKAWMAYNLADGEYTLQTARGGTFPNDGADTMGLHSFTDGPNFPWVATEKAKVASLPVDTEAKHAYIKGMKHYDIPRMMQYQMVVAHGILFLFGWWVFGAVSAMAARYLKPILANKRILGKQVWYLLHQILFYLSIICQAVGFIIVFVQAGDFKYCTHKCGSDDYALYMHTVLGIVATAACFLQVPTAYIRPSKDSKWRFLFNWFHWFFGFGSFVLATVVMFLSIPLGKSGLRRNWKLVPGYLMGAYVAAFILFSIILEFIVSRTERPKHKVAGKSDIAMKEFGPSVVGLPKGKNATSQPPYVWLRLVVLGVFTLVAIGFCAALSYMIESNLHAH